MKKILLCIGVFIVFPVSLFAYTSPGKPQGFVSDFARILSAVDIQTMNSQLQALQNSSSAQVAVVTIQALGNETIETYATKLFQEWGIGQKGKDNGLLILVAPNDRAARIEVGYGLEGAVTDIQAGNIVNKTMIPAFKAGDYGVGIKSAVAGVSLLIQGSPEAERYYSTQTQSNTSGSHVNLSVVFFFIIIAANALARILGSTKSWWLGGVLGAGVGIVIGLIFGFVFIGFGAIVILTIIGLIFDYIVSKHPPGPGSGGGFWPIFFGGGRGGSGGSGFGGFGGGSSGGGGASGKW